MTTTRTTCPKPGLYPGTPEPAYRAWKAVNASAIWDGRRSPRHLMHAIRTMREPTPTLQFGTLVHAAVLEPARFEAQTVPPPINPKTGEPYGADSKAYATYAAKHPGKMILSEADIARIGRIRDAVMSHKRARELLTIKGAEEVSGVWDCEGVRCKFRADRFLPGVCLVDLKTTRDASRNEFGWSCKKFGYYVRAAFYTDGCRALTGEDTDMVFIAVESDEPHGVACYTLDVASLAAGRALYRSTLRELAKCAASKAWHAYHDEIETLTVPGLRYEPLDPGDGELDEETWL